MENVTARPLVYTTGNGAKINPFDRFKSFVSTHLAKLLFGGLIVVIIIELIIGFRSFRPNQNIQNNTIYPLSEAKIALSSTKTTVAEGDLVPVKARIVTGGNFTDSTDLVVKFDPKYLETTGASTLVLGKTYGDYPIAEVDQTKGQIFISGITSPDEDGFNGIGEFATINFKAKATGTTTISVDFQKGQTIDSNIVKADSTTDLLSEVFNLDLTINQKGSNVDSNTAENQTQSCAGYYQYCQVDSSRSGKQFCRSGRVEKNGCVFDKSLTVSCEPCQTSE